MNPNKESKTKEFNKAFHNLKSKEIRKITRLLKKQIYPLIDLKMHHNSKYSEDDFLDLLTYVAMNHDFTNNGSKTFELLRENTPASNTVIYHIKKLNPEYVKNLFMETSNVLIKLASKHKSLKKRVDLAIDITEQMYYGNKNDYMVCETKPKNGTSHCFRYITINIVEKGKRFTLLALPMHQFDEKTDLIEKLVNYARKKVKIRYLYLDRGFDRIDVINKLKELKIKFIMPKKRNPVVKAYILKTEGKYSHVVNNFVMGRKNRDQAVFNLILVVGKTGDKVCFATNVDFPEPLAHRLLRLYGKRWGIETSYRVKGDFKPRTTSKYYSVRLFYFMWSVCLYNLWVLVSFLVALIFCLDLKKPLVTAKLFGTILYSMEPQRIT